MGAATGQILIDEPEIITKLETAFSMGCNDEEACLFAGISKAPFYAYIKQVPSFSERKEELKRSPILKAKTCVNEKLSTDVTTAKWYLERRTKEFKPPDKSTNIQLNQLHVLTDGQVKDRLAHKLHKLLTGPEDDVSDAEYTDNT